MSDLSHLTDEQLVDELRRRQPVGFSLSIHCDVRRPVMVDKSESDDSIAGHGDTIAEAVEHYWARKDKEAAK